MSIVELRSDSKALDPQAVVTEYRRILGFDDDLTDRLYREPLTPLLLVAGLSDLFFPIYLGVKVHEIGSLLGIGLGSGSEAVTLPLACCAALGFLIANSGDDYYFAGGKRISKPLGIFTAFLIRNRMKRRREAREKAWIDPQDPGVLAEVTRVWARPLLARAWEVLHSDGGPIPRGGTVPGLVGIGGDPAECTTYAERVQSARDELRRLIEVTDALTTDPRRAGDAPLVVLGQTFAALREAIAACERTQAEGEALRRSLRFVTGSLEGPIRSNEKR